MKKLCIITISQKVAEFYKEELVRIFGTSLEIDILSVEKTGLDDLGQYDLYLVGVTSSEFYGNVVSRLEKEKIVLSKLTYLKSDVEFLKSLEIDRAFYVNLSEKMAKESIANLYRLGVNNIDFYPYYPGTSIENLDINFAVTTGEARYAPDNIDNLIDLGNRYLRGSIISEIALKLDLRSVFSKEEYREYIDKLAEKDYSVNVLFNENYRIEKGYEYLADKTETGILLISNEFELLFINQYARDILNMESDSFSRYMDEIVEKIKSGLVKEDYLSSINGEEISISIVPIDKSYSNYDYYVFLNKFYQLEDNQIKLRKQLYKKSSSAKYNYDDILTRNKDMKELKRTAKNMSKSDSSILITGETGTGKELFAHSIHNSSKRRDYPFVAINCSAIPDNLLESELFGYKRGSFTGASKDGKKGLFEHAHGGSIFLDEIETMSPYLQAKILRVIEEKEIMRIGDLEPINIDVRIIAASNEDIYKKVENGDFRKDLYFRLNILPINIPPLRNRKEDIFLLADFFMKKSKASYKFSQESLDLMSNYKWEGNIRELKNLIEFFKYVDKELIETGDFPDHIKESKLDHSKVIEKPGLNQMKKDILEVLIESEKGIGRGKIKDILKTKGISYSEGEIRTSLRKLAEKNLVHSYPGRKGSVINKEKRNYIRALIGE